MHEDEYVEIDAYQALAGLAFDGYLVKMRLFIPEHFTNVFIEWKISMDCVNPKFILRNYLAEIAIRKAEDAQDYSEIERLLNILHHPFDKWTEFEDYASHPPNWARQISVSCSS